MLLLILFLLILPAVASADQYHYNNALIGDRASGMGGAYTAISDDATGLYYNPAGIVYSSGRNLSASVNAYYHSTKSYAGAIGGFDWERKSSALLPNYFGVIQPLGNFKLGFSYAVPDSSQEDQDQIFTNVSALTTKYIINFNNDDNTYNFGPTIAAAIGNDMSAGFTLYFYQRRWQYTLNEVVNYNTGNYAWTNQYFEMTEKGFRPVLGLMWSPVEKVSLGLAVSKVFLFDSTATQQVTCSDTEIDGKGCDTPLFRSDVTVTDKRKFPLNITAGAAYFPTEDLLLSVDIKYYSKVTDPIFGNREAVANLAVGTEYFLSKNWALRGGLFTDLANTPDVAAGGTNQPEHVDLYGVSGSISHFTRNTSVTLGGSIAQGTGKAQIVSGDPRIQDVDFLGWSVFLSSSYSY